MRISCLFIAIVLVLSCRKNREEVVRPEATTPVPLDSFYFKGKIGPDQFNWVVPSHKMEPGFAFVAGAHFGFTDLSATPHEGYAYYLSAGTEISANVPDRKPRLAVAFNMATRQAGSAEVSQWFVPGVKTFAPATRPGTDLLNPAYNGVYVYYVDASGRDWASHHRPQTAGYFQSVSFSDEPRTDVSHARVWKARFSATLYTRSGDSIRVENAEVSGPILLP